MNDCSYCKKYLSCIEMKPPLVQLALMACYLIHVAPCDSPLFSLKPLFKYGNTVMRSLLSLLFSRENGICAFLQGEEKVTLEPSLSRRDLTPLMASRGRFSSPLIIFVALLWTFSSLSTSVLNCGDS